VSLSCLPNRVSRLASLERASATRRRLHVTRDTLDDHEVCLRFRIACNRLEVVGSVARIVRFFICSQNVRLFTNGMNVTTSSGLTSAAGSRSRRHYDNGRAVAVAEPKQQIFWFQSFEL
jgi:hypothetical protein